MKIALLTQENSEKANVLHQYLIKFGFDPVIHIAYRQKKAGGFQLKKIKNLLRAGMFWLEKGRIQSIRNHNNREANRLFINFIKEEALEKNKQQATFIITRFDQELIAKKIKELGIDIVIVWGAPIIKEPLLSAPKICLINGHCSILPVYKGFYS